MASADQIKALIRSHAEGDDARFYAIAIQVAAQAARSGHTKLAQELRDMVDEMKERAGRRAVSDSRPVPLAQPRGELAELLIAAYPKVHLREMALAPELHGRLERVLREHRERERIREHGFTPVHKLLLIGPPGTGKTMTAHALAGDLGIPLFTVQLHGVITKFMGETAAKLRVVFDAIARVRAVYLFDEFDALGGDRGSTNDVGEIRRVLNSFLQFLDADASDSVILAATNHPALLDRALFRRFDMVIRYELPSNAVAERILRSRLALIDTKGISWPEAVAVAEGLSHADITRACDYAAKQALLEEREDLTTTDLVGALEERRLANLSE